MIQALSRSIKAATQNAAWEATQEASRQIRESREKVLAWTTTTAGSSNAQGGPSRTKEESNPDDIGIGSEDEDEKARPDGWSRYAYCEYHGEELPHEGGPCDCLHYPYDD